MAEMLQVWNMALGWVGTRSVAAAQENTLEATQCRLFWDSARRQVLRDFPWNFARRRAWLARVALPEGWEGEYPFAYALPADCLKVLGVLGGGNTRLPYSLAHDAVQERQVVLTGTARALLSYTADVRHVELFDDLCAHVLARRLAALVAVPLLRNNAAKVQELEQLYRAALPSACEADATEAPTVRGGDVWLECREGVRA